MHAADCRYDVVHDVAGFLLGKVVFLHDTVEEFRSLAVLSDDVLELPLLEYLVDLDNAGVILDRAVATRLLRRAISLRIMLLDLANLKVLIFLMALMCPVA